MYEKPILIQVGDASSLIRGIAHMGWDPDGHDFPAPMIFLSDPDPELEGDRD